MVRSFRLLATGTLLSAVLVVVPPALAQPAPPGNEQACPPPPCQAPTMPAQPTIPGQPPTMSRPETGEQPEAEPTPEPSGTTLAGGGPGNVGGQTISLFGDLLGPTGVRTVTVVTTTPTSTGRSFTTGHTVTIRVPVAAGGAASSFKITENDSPRPVDRVFLNYNYYNDADRFQSSTSPNFDVHSETIGFEKTFCNGNASFEMRLPFVQFAGDKDVSSTNIGDLSMVLKYAVYNDRDTGNLISTGLVLTVPTGPNFTIPGESDLNSTYIQPFVGYIWMKDQWFLEGFEAVIVPTDARDVTILTSDVALGYYCRLGSGQDTWLRGVAPVAELHVNDPLNHRGAFVEPVGFTDTVDMTVGSRFFFGRGSSLGLAVSVPLSGPHYDAYEGLAQLNIVF